MDDLQDAFRRAFQQQPDLFGTRAMWRPVITNLDPWQVLTDHVTAAQQPAIAAMVRAMLAAQQPRAAAALPWHPPATQDHAWQPPGWEVPVAAPDAAALADLAQQLAQDHDS